MIKRFTPHQASFDSVEKISNWNNYILILSTVIVIVTSFFARSISQLDGLKEGLNIFNSLLIFAYISMDILGSYLMQKAEARRRLDFIDNSFDTSLSGTKSENYFTNEMLSPGIYKMAVNCFENSLFSYSISKRMLKSLTIKNTIVVAIFILAATMGEKEMIILFFQLSLPFLLIQQLVKLVLYVTNTENVLDNFKTLFNDLKDADYEKKTPGILRNIIQYESNISWGSILLSSKIFNKLNPSLSEEWWVLKKEYKIESKPA
jgi:hypothetical protein